MIRVDSIKGRILVFLVVLFIIYFCFSLVVLLVYINKEEHDDLELMLAITLNESYQYVAEKQNETDLNILYNMPYMTAMLINKGARRVEFFFTDTEYRPKANEVAVFRQMENGKYFNIKCSDLEVKKYIVKTATMQLLQHLAYLVVILLLSVFFLSRLLRPLGILASQCRNYKDGDTFSQHSALLEIKQIESALNILIHRLDELRKKDKEIFALAAHELKTPLAIIKARVERFSSSSKYTKKAFIGDINDDIKRLYLEIKTLLYFNVFDFDEKREFSARNAIDEVVKKVDILLKNRALKVEVKGDDFAVVAQKNLFDKMFIVLLENAIIYAKADSTIEIIMRDSTIIVKNAQGGEVNLFSSKLGNRILEKISSDLDFTFEIRKDSANYEVEIRFNSHKLRKN